MLKIFSTCLLAAFFVVNLSAQSKKTSQELHELLLENTTFQTAFSGFFLADAVTGEEIFTFNPDKYFTPASNTKLFTFFLSRQILAESCPALFYQEVGDQLHLWGSGHPLLLHPHFDSFDIVRPWLLAQEKTLLLNSPPEETIARYGLGWSWDDYNDGYVYERTLFPVFGNSLQLLKSDTAERLQIRPRGIHLKLGSEGSDLLSRPEAENSFTAAPRLFRRQKLDIRRPLVMSPSLIAQLLGDALDRIVLSDTLSRPKQEASVRIEVPLPDTLYRRLMDNSDNFIAEQLLLLAACSRYGGPDIEQLFAYARDTLLADLQLIERQWVDGSGLSRYNQFTPRQLALLLQAILKTEDLGTLKWLFASGNSKGTLSGRFMTAERTPYLWAKTGSLRNVYCLSGFLETKAGKLLVFSFLHNNYPGRSGDLYDAMERAMQWIYEYL